MITTKRGDGGMTDCGGRRISKDNLLVETIGEIDELQAVLELVNQNPTVLAKVGTPPLDKGGIIKDLRVIMGELGTGKKFSISNPPVGRAGFQFLINKMDKEIEKNKINLNKFIIFKTKKAKELNWARTVCRRVEREIVSLSKQQTIDKDILKYFNRLSDYLYVLALKNN